MERIEDAPCGCPRYDMQPGIAKVHNKKCKDRPKKKKGGEKR